MPISKALLSALGMLESRRVSSRAKAWKSNLWIMGLAGLPASGLLMAGSAGWAMATMVLALIVAWVVRSRTMSTVSTAFKDEIMPVLVANIDDRLVYQSGESIEVDEFNASGLFRAPDRYGGKDLVSGYVGDTQVRFSMVSAEEEVEETTTDTDSDGNSTTTTTTHYETIFCGLLFTADFNKHLSGSTLINPGAAGFFSKFSGTLVKLEDPRFNSQFSVYSPDQVEARYVLTPSMMERLVNLKSKFGAIWISFVQERMYIAIGLNYNLFEPDLNRPLTDLNQVEGLVANLERITGIVADLDLNTRIWTKEGK
jgi:hypothetical protein